MKVWICYNIDAGYAEDPLLSMVVHKIFRNEETAEEFKDACYWAHGYIMSDSDYHKKQRKEARDKLRTKFGYEEWADSPSDIRIAEGEIEE